MALRMYSSIIRRSLCFSRVSSLSTPLHNASRVLLGMGCTARCPGNGVVVGYRFTPVCFITSDTFLNRLVKDKVAETDWLQPGGGGHGLAAVPPDVGEQLSLLVRAPNHPVNPKVLKVAIIGAANAGKSTLSNQLIGRKVFAVSKKVHTTRSSALGVLTEDDTQIILLDTPGLTTPSKVKRHKLEGSLLVDPWNTVKEADLLVVMVDISDKWTSNKLDFQVLKCLTQHPDIPAILVLNKVDLVKSKSRLLELTAELTAGVVNGRKAQVRSVTEPPQAVKSSVNDGKTPEAAKTPDTGEVASAVSESREQVSSSALKRGWPHFVDVFTLSAGDREAVDALKRHLVEAAKPGPWEYHSEVLTDQTAEEVCANTIREKLLEYLPGKVPYKVTQSIHLWQDRGNGVLDIEVYLYVSEYWMKVVIGPAGSMVGRITQEAGKDLSSMFSREVRLRVTVKSVKLKELIL